MAFTIFFFKFFEPENVKKPGFLGLILRFSNLNVLHKGLLMQDWVSRLGASLLFTFLLFHPNSQCTEVRFASLLSGGFIAAIVVNLPERELAKAPLCNGSSATIQWK